MLLVLFTRRGEEANLPHRALAMSSRSQEVEILENRAECGNPNLAATNLA
jgi:hypothetical protein